MSAWRSSLLPLADPAVEFEKVSSISPKQLLPDGRLEVSPSDLSDLTHQAFSRISHFLRPSHLGQLSSIVEDPEASTNDRAVAIDLLKNAGISAGGVLPMCQDTGTAMVYAKRGHQILSDGLDEQYIEAGIERAFREKNLRYSQLAPLTTWTEVNTGSNLPAEVDIQLTHGKTYEFLFIAKGGGSANKTFLFQQTKEILREDVFLEFLEEKLRDIGTSACPPYHLGIAIGGTSADFAVKTAKLAASRALDTLPTSGSERGHGFRDLDLEQKVLTMTQNLGIGAQFGGKYFCHDARIVRLPRHTGSLPIAIAVSCSADRQAFGRITPDGVFLERLEEDPARYLPDSVLAYSAVASDSPVRIDLARPMAEILLQLRGLPTGQRVELNGRLIVARDLAHARFRERLNRGQPLPDYLLQHPVYYAGPAKTPEGLPSGSFGPTTAGRMDGYMHELLREGGAQVTLAKGNRSPAVAEACGTYGGFYLATVGGPAALIAQDNIVSSTVVDMEDLGIEAVRALDVVNFPAYVVIDDKGKDFFAPTGGKPIRLGPTRLTGE